MSAIINGEAWSSNPAPFAGATVTTQAGSSVELLAIAGTNLSARYRNITIALTPAAVGSYVVQMSVLNPAGYAYAVQATSSAGDVWVAGANGPDGQVVVTSLTATRAVGTFEFVARNLAGDVLRVTNGRFDLPVTRTPTP